jgi:hypothetical protein
MSRTRPYERMQHLTVVILSGLAYHLSKFRARLERNSNLQGHAPLPGRVRYIRDLLPVLHATSGIRCRLAGRGAKRQRRGNHDPHRGRRTGCCPPIRRCRSYYQCGWPRAYLGAPRGEQRSGLPEQPAATNLVPKGEYGRWRPRAVLVTTRLPRAGRSFRLENGGCSLL